MRLDINISWKIVVYLVGKEANTKFRMKIKLRSVNAVSLSKNYAMRIVEAELPSLHRIKYFLSIDSYSVYRQKALQSFYYDFCERKSRK